MNVTYAEEAIADILDAIAYLQERNPAAASNLDADLAACRSGSLVRSWPVRLPPDSPSDRAVIAGRRQASK